MADPVSRERNVARILLVGNSVENRALMGCSVARGRLSYADVQLPLAQICDRCPEAWRETSVDLQPDLVVILIDAWQVVARLVGDKRYRTNTPEYREDATFWPLKRRF